MNADQVLSRRSFAKLLGATAPLAFLAGCGSSSSSSSSDSKSGSDSTSEVAADEMAITVFSQTANWSGDQVGWGATLLKDYFNLTATIVPDTNGAYQTRMENGDLGDLVIWGTNGTDYQSAVDQGKLFDWDEDKTLDSEGTDLKKYFQAALDANKELNSDGKLHGIGNNVTNEKGEHDLFIYNWGLRWDLYQKLGHPAVKTLDDLEGVLKDMQAACPTGDDGKPTYALSIWPDWDAEMVMYVKGLASAYHGYDELGIGLYDSATGKFMDALSDDGPYMEALKFVNKLYRDGLVDPDSMTQTYDEMITKVRNGNVLFSIFDYAGATAYNNDDHIADGKIMLPLVPSEAKVIVQGLSTSGQGRIWSIGDLCDDPDRVMQIINWLYTPEGALTNLYGLKGLMWDYDSDGNTKFTDLGKKCFEDPTTSLDGVEWTSPKTGTKYTLSGTYNDGTLQINNTTWANGAKNPEAKDDCFYQGTWASNIVDAQNDAEKDWRETTGAKSQWEYLNSVSLSVIPAANFAESARSSELELTWQQVIKTIKEGSWKAIYAKDDAEFASLVKDMQNTCAGYGYDDCVAWCQEEASRRFGLQEK